MSTIPIRYIRIEDNIIAILCASGTHWRKNTGLFAVSCWVGSSGIELSFLVVGRRRWTENKEEETMPERSLSFVFLFLSILPFLPSTQILHSFLPHFHSLLLFYFPFSLYIIFPLLPFSDVGFITCPPCCSNGQCLAILPLLLFPQNTQFCPGMGFRTHGAKHTTRSENAKIWSQIWDSLAPSIPGLRFSKEYGEGKSVRSDLNYSLLRNINKISKWKSILDISKIWGEEKAK